MHLKYEFEKQKNTQSERRFLLVSDGLRRFEGSDRKRSFTLNSSPMPSPPKDDDNEVFIIVCYGESRSEGQPTAIMCHIRVDHEAHPSTDAVCEPSS